MRIDLITIFPEQLEVFFQYSIVKRAQEKGLVQLFFHNLRDYSESKSKTVDDYPFGGGAGMVMSIEPLAKCIEKLKAERTYDEIIYLTPDGEPFKQKNANTLSLSNHLMMICGHYKGIDQRVRDLFVTKEISIGDYVLTGGELPAAVICDSIIRLIPCVISDETSALSDSFQDNLLAPPVYTRPAEFRGLTIPAILLSGHTSKIEEWRLEESIRRTKERRPDLLS